MASANKLDNLKINYLTEEQYNTAKDAGQINENEIYMTPNSSASAEEVAELVMTNYIEAIDKINGESVYSVNALDRDLDLINGEVI